MNLVAKENKLPIEFVVKVVMIGFTMFMLAFWIFLTVITILAGLITGNEEIIGQLDLYMLILPLVFIFWGFALGIIVKLGLMLYSKFKPIKISIE